jgi:transposase-like protein
MIKQNIEEALGSSVVWDNLEGWARGLIQGALQDVLEEEVTELLGRLKSERHKPVDGIGGYRNGYGKPRKLTMSSGTVTVRRPRVRALEQRFESRILPLFARRTQEVNDLIPELYLHGLAEGDFDLALRGLLGEDAPISATTVARLKGKWKAEYEAWASRPLDSLEVTYLWVDGVYVKAGLEKEKAALLVAIGALSDGSKVVLAVQSGHRESIESWSSMLRSLRDRGLPSPRLVIGDGHLGIWGGLRNVYPEADEQRCWNHRILNVLDKLPKKHQPAALEMLKKLPYADTVKEIEKAKVGFQRWCNEHRFDRAAKVLDEDWDRMIAFYRFPKPHWRHLRTSNPVESPFAALRLRTNAAKRFKKVENATAVIWKMLLIAEKRFQKLNSPELVRVVWGGTRFVNGKQSSEEDRRVAA